MADAGAQDRNLPASAKKLAKARAEGQIPRSRDLGHFASLSVATAVAFAVLPTLSSFLQHLLADGLRFDRRILASPELVGQHAIGLFLRGFQVVLIIGAVMGFVGIAASVALGGWNFTLKAIHPDFSRMNPLPGLARLFNRQQLVNTLKACLLAGAVGTAGVMYLNAHVSDLSGALTASLPAGLEHVATTVGGGLLVLLLVLFVWAAVDVPLQKWQHATRLKMSPQELKQEQKESENPEVKSKQKAKMRQMARRRMMTAVPKADIVVMNPTHYAVAIKYDEEAGGAPRVVAKGTDRLAFRIRDLAVDARVPVITAPPLARALYAHCELDQEVPAQLFAAVAQVLAWVFQLRRHPSMNLRPPEVSVPDELDPLKNPLAGKPGRRRPAAE
jgi:flagellar biosynthetic protein FlhB